MKTEQELIDYCLARLAAEGIEAFTEMELDVDGEECGIRVRVPTWECNNEELTLSRKAIYDFIHAKLAGLPLKGFVASAPGLSFVDVYCYDQASVDEGKTLGRSDVMFWGVGAQLDKFCWAELVEGDDSAWWDGWEAPSELFFASNRLATLAAVLNCQVVDLPPVEPLTRLELIERLKHLQPHEGIICLSEDKNDRWELHRNTDGELFLHKRKEGSMTPIHDEHFDDKGRLVLDGFVIMHRCHGF
ncbi:hypothetical protein [Pseudomonas sp. MWU12-2323]|uniref:hypothetical protein n=1 Tax=Pseudomonas sp. MWU12-2323 TaxID=2651296 RepID=UPI00128E73C9|nr:hypothetical protein [Pseudomonas sp. MWU12-2323]MPQ71478.1 hypothetical protein [Pseudomonas sp. MWU12-2323]